MPSGCFAVKLRITPTTTLAWFCPYGRSTGTQAPLVVEVVLDELAGREVRPAPASRPGASMRTISYG